MKEGTVFRLKPNILTSTIKIGVSHRLARALIESTSVHTEDDSSAIGMGKIPLQLVVNGTSEKVRQS